MDNRSMPPGTIIPELAYSDVAAAAEWLCRTFGFKERLRIGTHRVQLVFGQGSIVVVESGGNSPPDAGAQPQDAKSHRAATHSLMVKVADVDGHYAHAQESGSQILNVPQTYPYGERQYTAVDPGGHIWTFSQAVADVDPEEWGGRLIEP
jgi:uncharacterized glyoxalase superfamily protein PhnB